MFVNGAGGSGKRHVVREVLKYAEEYTNLRYNPGPSKRYTRHKKRKHKSKVDHRAILSTMAKSADKRAKGPDETTSPNQAHRSQRRKTDKLELE